MGKQININGYEFPRNQGGTFQLRPGDLAFSQFGETLKLQFKVLQNGKISLNKKSRTYLNTTEEAKKQTLDFRSTDAGSRDYKFATLQNKMEILEDKPLENGFSYYSLSAYFNDDHIPSQEKWNDGKWSDQYSKYDLLYFDLTQDVILQNMIKYFKVEANIFNYTEQEKAFRLAHLLSNLINFTNQNEEDRFNNRNFLIGEILNAGQGVCRHIALIYKAISDQIGLKCSLVSSDVSGGAHSWNYCKINETYYLVDATQKRFVEISDSMNQQYRKNLHFIKFKNYYGIPNSLFN